MNSSKVDNEAPGTAESHPIGSDMETSECSELDELGTVPPWQSDRPLIYCQTGRQALQLVGDSMWDRGLRRLLLPEFLCDTMITPFMSHPWLLVPVRVSSGLNMDLDDLSEKAESQQERFLALTARYFGKSADAEYREAVAHVQRAGGTVIDDETHRLFSPGGTSADISIASLRKLLPVSCGAYIAGDLEAVPALAKHANDAPGRWRAMDQKQLHLSNPKLVDNHTKMFETENRKLESNLTPTDIDPRSLATLSHLDYQSFAVRRRMNRDRLREAAKNVSGLTFLNITSDQEVPSHELIRTSDPKSLQKRLAELRIYCPIHWPPSQVLPAENPWPNTHISIPIDHRYTDKHMDRIANTLKQLAS